MSYKKTKFFNKDEEKGFVILLAVLVSGIVLFIGISVYNILSNHLVMSRINQNSQEAFYAADAGIECVLYWDFKQEEFSTSSPANINCDGNDYTVPPDDKGGDVYEWKFYLNFQPDPYCTEIILEKDINPSTLLTKIESRGYNTGYDSDSNNCSKAHPEKVQRAIRVRY